ncbi:MAG: TetR/AcrR family transcriptional regulator [Candidatus Obscuribacterales bacterium]|nr:TetR/AcrR family transcriptional regulator [Candidatus Obscuribacterales bacterium]
MPRIQKEDKKAALVAAAIRVFASQGLGAPTAMIAKEADVANGTLFNNFPTKTDLLNYVYIQIKQEVIETAIGDAPVDADLKQQAYYMWSRWTRWGAANPDKRRTLAMLCVSDEISEETRRVAGQGADCIGDMLTRCVANGHLRGQPLTFVTSILEALANMTIDFMIENPDEADKHSDLGFETFWRAIS